MGTQQFDVLDQVRRGVVLQPAQRPRAASAALVEYDDAPERRVEKSPMHRARARSWAAMQEKHWKATRIARLLPVHHVGPRERQVTGLEWSDFGEQVASGHRA